MNISAFTRIGEYRSFLLKIYQDRFDFEISSSIQFSDPFDQLIGRARPREGVKIGDRIVNNRSIRV